MSSPSVGLTFIVHLKIISKLKAGSVSKVKAVSANADTILVAINKRTVTTCSLLAANEGDSIIKHTRFMQKMYLELDNK